MIWPKIEFSFPNHVGKGIQWTRGFFRIWLLCSVIWVGHIVNDTYGTLIARHDDIWVPFLGSDYEPDPKNPEWVWLKPGLFEEMKRGPAPPPNAKEGRWVPWEQTAQFKAQPRYMQPGTWEFYLSQVRRAIWPPLTAMLAGLALGWVIRGFRHEKE